MKLEELLDEELYKQVKAKIDEFNGKETDKLKHIRYADLSEGQYISKDKYATLETDHGTISEQLKTAQGLIDELKKGTTKDEGLQGKIGEYETTISTLEAENRKLKTESALKVALLDAGAKPSDMDYLLYKAGKNSEIKLADDGKIKGQETLISGLKASCPSQFATADNKQVQEHKLETGDNNKTGEEPKSLAEALKQQYEEATKTTNVN